MGESWLEPPRLLTAAEPGQRHASWLELFFDLVFVVAVAVLVHELVADHSATGFLKFAGLFVPVYVAWQGYMAYATRFDTDDLAFRLAYFGGMVAIAAMAVLTGDVWDGENTAEFAVAYAVLRSLVVALYWRAWRWVPEARPLIRRYGAGYGAGVALWLGSLAVGTPARYAVWGVALALELSLPPLSTRLHRHIPTHGRHLPERWGLFTIIVLGESVVAVALETADSDWRPASVTAAVLGFAAVAGVWWLYFDRLAHVELEGTSPAPVVYSYAHLPLLMGLAAMSAGIALVIERAGEDRLGPGASVALLGGAAVFLLSLIAARWVTVRGPHGLGLSLKLATATLIGALVLADGALPPLALAGGLAVLLAAMVVAERTLISPQPLF